MINAYPYEKFSNAIHTLATSSAPLQDRIDSAFTYNISYVKAEDIPEDVRPQLRDIQDKLSNSSASNLSTEEAETMARDIMYIADVINTAYHEG